VVGCDFSAEAVAIGRRCARDLANVRFEEADVLALPFDERAFDAVVCINVLHHVAGDDIPKALVELARITRRTLIVEIKNRDNPFYRYRYDNGFGVAVYPTTTAEVCAVLEPLGFELEQTRGIFLLTKISPLLVLRLDRTRS